jgi:hypothetical protein
MKKNKLVRAFALMILLLGAVASFGLADEAKADGPNDCYDCTYGYQEWYCRKVDPHLGFGRTCVSDYWYGCTFDGECD